MMFLVAFILCASITAVQSGCGELRLCCPGRNMSCIALDTVRPKSNSLIPEGREGPRKTGKWHMNVDQGAKLVDGSIDGGDRFYESLLAPSSSLGNKEGGGASSSTVNKGRDGSVKAENVELAKEDEEEFQFQSTSSIKPSTVDDLLEGSGEGGDYGGSGEEEESYASVDWLNSASKEEEKTNETEETKIDNYRIAENDRYELVKPDEKEFREGKHLMIRYVIESDEIPVTIEQLEMLQNYRSLVGGEDRHCYCDEACRALGDCCSDYAAVCPVIDCLVTEWSGWSPCQANGYHQKYGPDDDSQPHCGLGVSRRERRIIRQAMHGGRPCPILEQQSSCFSTDTAYCQERSIQEVAQILPYEYGRARIPGYTNNSAGIFFDFPEDIEKLDFEKTHYIIFEITWSNSACADDEHSRHLQLGRRVCVECQPAAQTIHGKRCVGEGVQGQPSTWNLISNAKHCHGFWRQLQYAKPIGGSKCEADSSGDPRYLFV